MTPAIFLANPLATEAIVNNWRPPSSDNVFILTKRAKSYSVWGTALINKVTRLQDGWVRLTISDHRELPKQIKLPKLFHLRQCPSACLLDLEEFQ